jgi:DNA (cytosine-5)-methyltransferase 1
VNSVELFSGAGGLAIGISKAGFCHKAVIDRDKNACKTIRENQRRGVKELANWSVFEKDIARFDFTEIELKNEVDLLSGGPPCQPFSIGGKHCGSEDDRNMFPHFFRAVRELKPKAFIVENVKGLLRSSFAKYFEYIILQLTYPEVVQKLNEDWLHHLSRLEQHHTASCCNGLSYRVVFRLLNAADYGIPQKRERVFIVGFRSDLGLEWSFPEPTCSQEALHWEQWVTGNYWERHQVAKSDRPEIPSKFDSRTFNLQLNLFSAQKQPWQTVRDTISDLPPAGNKENQSSVLNHVFIPGAKQYPGHTGSLLDEPAKTLKAGVHGVPGGENMLVYPTTGQVRYFTLREAARLQTFPDEYFFPQSWTETMKQLGNAVPVALAEVIASSIRARLETVLTVRI